MYGYFSTKRATNVVGHAKPKIFLSGPLWKKKLLIPVFKEIIEEKIPFTVTIESIILRNRLKMFKIKDTKL